jgi:hypothetical protein
MSINSIVEDALSTGASKCLDLLGINTPGVVPPNCRIIFSHETGIEPTNTYLVIHILDMPQQGRLSEATFVEPTKNQLWNTAFYNVLTQFSFIGNKAADYGFDFNNAVLNNRRCIEEFQRQNLAITTRSGARKQPQPRETKWVDAVNMDFGFSFSVQARQDIDWVEFITVNGELIKIYNNQ